MTRVFWTASAKADLAAISDYIATDHPQRALSFVDEIITAGEAIAEAPLAFPLVRRLEDRGLRKRAYGRYLIFYRFDGRAVHIIHVVHGARDYVRALFSDDVK